MQKKIDDRVIEHIFNNFYIKGNVRKFACRPKFTVVLRAEVLKLYNGGKRRFSLLGILSLCVNN